MAIEFHVEEREERGPRGGRVVHLLPAHGYKAVLSAREAAALSAVLGRLTDHSMAAVVYQLDDVASDEPLEGFVILDTAGRFHPCEFVVRTCDIGSTLGEVLRSCWPRCPQVFPIPSGVSDARDVGDLLRDEVSVRSRMEIAAFGCVMDLVGSDGAVTLVQVESAGAPFASLCLELFEQFGVPVRLAGAG